MAQNYIYTIYGRVTITGTIEATSEKAAERLLDLSLQNADTMDIEIKQYDGFYVQKEGE